MCGRSILHCLTWCSTIPTRGGEVRFVRFLPPAFLPQQKFDVHNKIYIKPSQREKRENQQGKFQRFQQEMLQTPQERKKRRKSTSQLMRTKQQQTRKTRNSDPTLLRNRGIKRKQRKLRRKLNPRHVHMLTHGKSD